MMGNEICAPSMVFINYDKILLFVADVYVSYIVVDWKHRKNEVKLLPMTIQKFVLKIPDLFGLFSRERSIASHFSFSNSVGRHNLPSGRE